MLTNERPPSIEEYPDQSYTRYFKSWGGKITMLVKIQFALSLIAALLLAGCEKSPPPAAGAGMATQGTPPPPAQTYDGVDLAQLTRDLKRWIITTKERPASFEEYVAKAKVTVPPAPPGKKFALSKEMRVILVDR